MNSLKRFILKHVGDPNLVKYAAERDRRGFRKIKNALIARLVGRRIDVPVDCKRADHVHVYLSFACNNKCEFCINRIANGGVTPVFALQPLEHWQMVLNSFYNLRELVFNGGEHFLIPWFGDLLNSLEYFNITAFTSLPAQGMEQVKRLVPGTNNLILKISYHPKEDPAINLFIERLRQIPKGVKWHVHVIRADGISTEMYLDRFRREGIIATANELVFDPEMLKRDTRLVWCDTHEHIIGPDLQMYRCLIYLLLKKFGTPISEYTWGDFLNRCYYWPRCSTCNAYNDVYFEVKE